MSDHKYQLTALILQVEESAKELKVSAKVAMYGAAIVAKEKVSAGHLEVLSCLACTGVPVPRVTQCLVPLA
jgi:hypothetical protein